jgi:TRAP-type C4-dicarboxylate transport system substrate-binding protein
MTLVVALLLTADSASAFAREFRAADARSEDYPTVEALRYMGNLVAECSGGRLQVKVFHSRRLGEVGAETVELPYSQVLTGRATQLIAQHVPAIAQLIKRIRKVE